MDARQQAAVAPALLALAARRRDRSVRAGRCPSLSSWNMSGSSLTTGPSASSRPAQHVDGRATPSTANQRSPSFTTRRAGLQPGQAVRGEPPRPVATYPIQSRASCTSSALEGEGHASSRTRRIASGSRAPQPVGALDAERAAGEAPPGCGALRGGRRRGTRLRLGRPGCLGREGQTVRWRPTARRSIRPSRSAQDLEEAVDIHRLVQTVVDRHGARWGGRWAPRCPLGRKRLAAQAITSGNACHEQVVRMRM